MPGKRRRFRRHAFHQVAVTHQGVNFVVHNFVAGPVEVRPEIEPGDGHAHAVAEALSERAGGGLDAFDEQMLRMARSLAAPLAKLFDVVERQAVSGQVKKTVEQHAAVAGRQDEAVAIRPSRLVGVVAKKSVPQDVGHRRGAHGKPGVAGIGLLDGVHGQATNGVDAKLIKLGGSERHLLPLRDGLTIQWVHPPIEAARVFPRTKSSRAAKPPYS